MIQIEGELKHPSDLMDATHALLDFTGEYLAETNKELKWLSFTELFNKS